VKAHAKNLRGRGDTAATAVLLGPAVVLVGLVLYVPTAYVAVQAFFDWHPNGSSPFVGLENFAEVISSNAFQSVMWNQFVLLLGMPLWVLVPLMITFLLYEDTKAPGVWRTIYFLPAVLSPALVGILFRSLLGTNGVINDSLRSVGLDSLALDWLTNPHLVKPVIIMLILWAGVGTGVVIFSAALSAVPTELFEAARIDGAGWWARMIHIAIPSIRDAIYLWIAFQVLALFLFMFGWVFVLTAGGPGLASTTIDYLIYQEVFRFGFFPTAAAMAVLMILVLLALFGIPAAFVQRRTRGAT